MKNISLSFNSEDVKAISCTLSVLPSYDAFDSFPPDLIYMPANVIRKLTEQEQLDQRELYLIAVSVDFAYKALRGELTIEDEALSKLRMYFFTINKLHPSFSSLLGSE